MLLCHVAPCRLFGLIETLPLNEMRGYLSMMQNMIMTQVVLVEYEERLKHGQVHTWQGRIFRKKN